MAVWKCIARNYAYNYCDYMCEKCGLKISVPMNQDMDKESCRCDKEEYNAETV